MLEGTNRFKSAHTVPSCRRASQKTCCWWSIRSLVQGKASSVRRKCVWRSSHLASCGVAQILSCARLCHSPNKLVERDGCHSGSKGTKSEGLSCPQEHRTGKTCFEEMMPSDVERDVGHCFFTNTACRCVYKNCRLCMPLAKSM